MSWGTIQISIVFNISLPGQLGGRIISIIVHVGFHFWDHVTFPCEGFWYERQRDSLDICLFSKCIYHVCISQCTHIFFYFTPSPSGKSCIKGHNMYLLIPVHMLQKCLLLTFRHLFQSQILRFIKPFKEYKIKRENIKIMRKFYVQLQYWNFIFHEAFPNLTGIKCCIESIPGKLNFDSFSGPKRANMKLLKADL